MDREFGATTMESVISDSPSDNTKHERDNGKQFDDSAFVDLPGDSSHKIPEDNHSRSMYDIIFHPTFPKVGTNLRNGASSLPRLPPFHFPKVLPSINFPNQGHGKQSEFDQACPIWAHQPYKAMYTVYFILVTAFVYLPFQALKTIPRSQRGRSSWSWFRSITVIFLRRCITYACQTRVILTKTAPKCDPSLKNSEFVWLEPYDYLTGTSNDEFTESSDIRGELVRAMNIQHVQPAKLCGYWFNAKDCGLNHTVPASQDESVVYFLHGGAYWMGSAHESSPNAGMNRFLLQRLSRCAGKVPKRVFALEYRLANHKEVSDGSYPAALLDAFVGYLYLIRACKFSAKNIVLMGDSSGGNLALALCRYLRDEQVVEMPGSMVLISPWSDVSRSHSGPIQAPNSFSTTILNKNSDLIDPSIMYRNTSNCAFLGNLPASEAYLNPYISPVSLQLDYSGAGLPPHWGFQNFPKRIYIMTGTAELNNEQHLTLAHRLAQGTIRGVPEYVGDRVSAGEPVDQFTWREKYPRSHRFADSNLRKQHSGMWDDCPLEDREVVLDEVKDAIHVFPVFSWYEPERTLFIDRVARWLAHEPVESGSSSSADK